MLEELLKLVQVIEKDSLDTTTAFFIEACSIETPDFENYIIVLPKNNVEKLLNLFREFDPDNINYAEQLAHTEKGPKILATAIMLNDCTTITAALCTKYGSIMEVIDHTDNIDSSFHVAIEHTPESINCYKNIYNEKEVVAEKQRHIEDSMFDVREEFSDFAFSNAISKIRECAPEHKATVDFIVSIRETDARQSSDLLYKLLDSLAEQNKI